MPKLLDIGKVESLPEIFGEIKIVRAAELQDIAREMFDVSQMSVLTFLPEEDD